MMDEVATSGYLREHDAKGLYPYAGYDKWVDMGLLGLPFPEEYGGYGGDVIDMTLVSEELGRKAYPFLEAYDLSAFSALSLLHNGSETQKKHYLPKLIKGEIRVPISMTEPDAGNMPTLAVADGANQRYKLWAAYSYTMEYDM